MQNTVFSLVCGGCSGLNAVMAAGSVPVSGVSPANDGAGAPFDALLCAVGRNHDREAFIRLFRHFAPRIKSFLMKGGASPEQAEDLAQETMIAVWTRAAQFDPGRARAGTWIFTIARNKRIDALRKARYAEYDPADPAFVPDGTPAMDDALARTERAAQVAGALRTLPVAQAALIRKAYFEDKTHRAIATEENLPLGTVKSRLRLAFNRLRPLLGQEEPEKGKEHG